jgi:hypothetical protein
MPKILPWIFIIKKRFDSFDKFKDYIASDFNCLTVRRQNPAKLLHQMLPTFNIEFILLSKSLINIFFRQKSLT